MLSMRIVVMHPDVEAPLILSDEVGVVVLDLEIVHEFDPAATGTRRSGS
jgi:hypothetical protein